MAIIIIIEELEIYVWFYFPNFECISQSLYFHSVVLLDCKSNQYEAIVMKIYTFIGRIAHVAIGNVIYTKKYEKLATMWYQRNTSY